MAVYNRIAQPAQVNGVEDLAKTVEHGLGDKSECGKLEDEAGAPRRLSADAGPSAMYAMLPKCLEDSVLFQNEAFARWEEMFDRLAALSFSKVPFGLAKQQSGAGGGAGKGSKGKKRQRQ